MTSALYGFKMNQNYYLIWQHFDGGRDILGNRLIEEIKNACELETICNWPMQVLHLKCKNFDLFSSQIGTFTPTVNQAWSIRKAKQGPTLTDILKSGVLYYDDSSFGFLSELKITEGQYAYVVNLDQQTFDFYIHNAKTPRDSFHFNKLPDNWYTMLTTASVPRISIPIKFYHSDDDQKSAHSSTTSFHEPLYMLFGRPTISASVYQTYFPMLGYFLFNPTYDCFQILEAVCKRRKIILLVDTEGIKNAFLLLTKLDIPVSLVYRFVNMNHEPFDLTHIDFESNKKYLPIIDHFGCEKYVEGLAEKHSCDCGEIYNNLTKPMFSKKIIRDKILMQVLPLLPSNRKMKKTTKSQIKTITN